MQDVITKSFASQRRWREWLEKNHETSDGVWVRIFKKASAKRTVFHSEALDEALCFGWIDGQRKSGDEESFLQKFTPRRAKSIWSKRNQENVQRLIDEGRMSPAGHREIERAKKDGRWENAYGGRAEMEVPADFLETLAGNEKAGAFFATLNKTNLFAIAFRLHNAKQSATRRCRIDAFIEKFERGEPLV